MVNLDRSEDIQTIHSVGDRKMDGTRKWTNEDLVKSGFAGQLSPLFNNWLLLPDDGSCEIVKRGF